MTLSSRLCVPTSLPVFLIAAVLPLATLVAQSPYGAKVSLPHTSQTRLLGFDAGEKHFVTQSLGHVAVWDVESGKQVLREKAESPSCKISKGREDLIFVQKRNGKYELLRYKIGESNPAASYVIPKDIDPESFCFTRDKRYILAAYSWRKETPEQAFLLDRQSLKPLPDSQQPGPLPSHEYELAERVQYLKAIQDELASTSLAPLGGWKFFQRMSTPDGRFLFKEDWPDSGEKTTYIQLHDIADGKLLGTHESTYLANRDFAFHPSEPVYAVGSGLRTVKIHSSRNGELVRELPALEQDIQDLSFTPDGEQIVALTVDGMLARWRVADYQPLPERDLELEAKMMTFDDAGRIYVTGSKTICVDFTRDSETLLAEVPADTIHVSLDAERLLLSGRHSGAKLFAIETAERPSLRQVATLSRLEGARMQFSPDGSAALTVSSDHFRKGALEATLLNVESGSVIRNFSPKSIARRSEASIYPKRISKALVNSSRGQSGFLALNRKPSELHERYVVSSAKDLRLTSKIADEWWSKFTPPAPDTELTGPQLVHQNRGNGKVNLAGWHSYNSVVQFQSGEATHKYQLDGMRITAATSTKQNDRVFVAFRPDSRQKKAKLIVAEFSASNGELLRQRDVTHPNYPDAWEVKNISLSPDDRFLAICFDYELAILDLQTNQPRSVGPAHYGLDEFVEFDSRNQYALLHGRQKILWDLQQSKKICEIGACNAVENIYFSPNGETLTFTVGSRGPVLMRCEDGEPIHQFPQNTEIRFSPDGSCLTAKSHHELQLWDFDAGKLLFKPEPPESRTQHCEHSAQVHFIDQGEVTVLLESDSDGNIVFNKVETSSGKLLDNLKVRASTENGWFKSHSQLLANNRLLANTSSELWVIGLSPLAVKQQFPLSTRPSQRAIYCQADDAVLIQMEDSAELRDTASGELIRTFENVEGRLALSEDESRLIAQFRNGHSIRTWDTQTGELLQTIHSDLLREEATRSP
ncbi:MAG: WD40 repeat domain-containing protein [Planctomycetota bacterium]